MLVLTPAKLAAAHRDFRRRREEGLRGAQERATSRRSGASCSRSCFPNVEEAKAAADKIAQGHDVRALADRARPQGQRHRSRHGDQDRAILDPRSPMPRSRSSRARSARRSRAVSAPCWCRSARSSRHKIKPFEEVADELKRDLAVERAQGRSADACTTRSRTSGAPARRSPRLAKKVDLQTRTIDAIDRSGRGPDGKPVPDLPQGVDLLGARLRAPTCMARTIRCSCRRTAAMSGTK